ncbi:Ppx/GppA family phosphatase [bacterium]|nr:Ppx/GppA family phosphatase [bacterium]
MVRKASIDIGTNSTRLLVAEINPDHTITPLYAAERITRLGESLSSGGALSEEAMTRVTEALVEYRSLAQAYGVEAYHVIATSATREASNQAFFLQKIAQETGFQVRVVAGETEAYLSFIGALHDQPAECEALVCDIGGGSTEFVMGRRGRMRLAASLPLGSRRLTETFFLPKRPVEEAVAETERYCRQELERRFHGVARPKQGLACGGTATTLAMMTTRTPLHEAEKIHGYLLTQEELVAVLRDLAVRSMPERQKMIGLHPLRADVILAGAVILEAIMSYWQLSGIRISLADLLYGVLLQEGQ